MNLIASIQNPKIDKYLNHSKSEINYGNKKNKTLSENRVLYIYVYPRFLFMYSFKHDYFYHKSS
jgi:hypothetical protein